jgi:chaperone modulatory protein CbpM
MMKESGEIILTGIMLDETTTFTLAEVRKRFDLRDEILQEMLAEGLIEAKKQIAQQEILLDLAAIRRIESALHLQEDLGVNIPGAALVLDLVAELDMMRTELIMLHKHLDQHSD